jgi:hypothetical protein
VENLWKKYNKPVENTVYTSDEMCGSQCIRHLTDLQSCAIVNLTGVCYNYCGVCGVMRKNQTSLTYKTLKTRELFQVLKKIFWGEKSPVRLLYNDVYGTETSPLDEFSYIGICLWEGLNILGSHYMKKFSQGKNGL